MIRQRDLAIPSGDYVLADARVPASLLAAPVAADEDGVRLDLAIEGGRIARIAPSGTLTHLPVVDLGGRQVWPMLVDVHTHLDKGQAIPRTMPDGTIATGANGTAADRAHWTEADIERRMEFGLRCAFVHGVAAIRTHIDSNHELTERAWGVFRGLRDRWHGRVTLQGVGLAPLDMYLGDAGVALADLVARSGGVLGGVTDGIGDDWADTARLDAALDRILALAEARMLDVDLHVDQSADPAAFALPRIAEAVLRTKFGGRVLCGHCVNLSLQPADVVARTLDLCARARLDFATMPAPMVTLMDRMPGRTPRWRGLTLALELRAAGLAVALGGDNCRDAWFAYGDHDMVDTFRQGVRVLQLDHPIAAAPAMVGPVPAAIMGLDGIGTVREGAPARLIVFAARTLNELMCRPQSDRIVLDRGVRVHEPLPDYAELD